MVATLTKTQERVKYKKLTQAASRAYQGLQRRYKPIWEMAKRPNKKESAAIRKVVSKYNDALNAVSVREQSWKVWFELANLCSVVSDLPLAIEFYQRALAAAPKNRQATICQEACWVALDANDQDLGVYWAKKLTQQRKQDPYAWTTYALALTMARKFDLALRVLNAKTKLDPTLMHLRALYIRGVKNGQFKQPKTTNQMWDDLAAVFNGEV